jgi:hypothetical protein
MNQEFQRPRTSAIVRFTDLMFAETSLRPKAFAALVVDAYHARVAPEDRTVNFQIDGDPEKVAIANKQLMNRFRAQYEDNSLRFPLDLQEAWVAALPEPYRGQCRAELARRDGLLCVPLPDLAGETDLESVGNVTRDFARSLTSISPTLDDQVIDEHDLPHIPAVIAALDSLIGSATSLRARYVEQLGKASPAIKA